ncbi:MAG: HNH endonuclease [Pseudonocardia sp.]|nr:HNH endonuclease [Pseudonocardia sp.]
MLIGQVVPEGLAAMPPGPELACLLADVDPTLVPNDDVVDVLQACSRQLAHYQARMFDAMSEVISRLPFAGPLEIRRADHPDQYGSDEVAAALCWTRRSAEFETNLAYTLTHILPLVQEALMRGLIDRGKARVFAQHMSDLPPEQIAAICSAVLPLAPGLTAGQIAERIKRLILELDPAYYERRYRKGIRDRMVVAYLDFDGTAVISASGLPADEAAAAWERIDSTARAARHDGHPGTLDQIRADVVMGLYDGSLHGLTRPEILQALVERFAGHTEPNDEEHAGTLVPTGTNGPGSGNDPSGSDPGGNGPGPGSARPDDTEPGPTTTPPVDQPLGVEVRVPLSTLLELDDRAGELPGWGPIPASAARRLVARQRLAQWRWVVVDGGGHLVAEGLTRRRPTTSAHAGPRGGVVELQVPATLLATLAADSEKYGPWAAMIDDIATRYTAQRAAHGDDSGERGPGERSQDGRDPDGQHLTRADLDANPDDRFPRAALRRHVQVRDRTCVHPGCRCPAVRADMDHTLDHIFGGRTTQDDLAPLCRHHHMMKTEGGWRLEQPSPGRFVWHSPLGRIYPVRPEPILPPPPDPVTRDLDPSFDEPAPDGDYTPDLTVRERAPPKSDPGPRSPGPGDGSDDPAPF